QLQVVDDDGGEAVAVVQDAGLVFDLADGDGGVVADPQRCGGHGLEDAGDSLPVSFGEFAVADGLVGDAGFGGEDPFEDLLSGHLEADDGDGVPLADGDVAGHVGEEQRLAGAGGGGDGDELLGPQSA